MIQETKTITYYYLLRCSAVQATLSDHVISIQTAVIYYIHIFITITTDGRVFCCWGFPTTDRKARIRFTW